jgi:hypothetical protein
MRFENLLAKVFPFYEEKPFSLCGTVAVFP